MVLKVLKHSHSFSQMPDFFPRTFSTPFCFTSDSPWVVLFVCFAGEVKEGKMGKGERSSLPTLTYTPQHTRALHDLQQLWERAGAEAQQEDTRLCWKSIGAKITQLSVICCCMHSKSSSCVPEWREKHLAKLRDWVFICGKRWQRGVEKYISKFVISWEIPL